MKKYYKTLALTVLCTVMNFSSLFAAEAIEGFDALCLRYKGLTPASREENRLVNGQRYAIGRPSITAMIAFKEKLAKDPTAIPTTDERNAVALCLAATEKVMEDQNTTLMPYYKSDGSNVSIKSLKENFFVSYDTETKKFRGRGAESEPVLFAYEELITLKENIISNENPSKSALILVSTLEIKTEDQ
ncbi:MAG: hypothetical protein K2X98_05555 [Alphaproteobacteria bacterium]|nr:hypothetical protein [Alphaproteobacteria bacterium]